jgi:hypothetical protein
VFDPVPRYPAHQRTRACPDCHSDRLRIGIEPGFLGSRIPLIAVTGSGSGIVNDSATANDGGFTLRGQVNINVHGAPPDTLLCVQIAADVGLPGAPEGEQNDGVCQRAAAGLFAPLASYPGGPPATLQTSPGGAGAAHTTAAINNPFLSDGGRVDVVIRLLDVLPPGVPSVELRTPCYIFEIK